LATTEKIAKILVTMAAATAAAAALKCVSELNIPVGVDVKRETSA